MKAPRSLQPFDAVVVGEVVLDDRRGLRVALTGDALHLKARIEVCHRSPSGRLSAPTRIMSVSAVKLSALISALAKVERLANDLGEGANG